jgi:hypothetical protein
MVEGWPKKWDIYRNEMGESTKNSRVEISYIPLLTEFAEFIQRVYTRRPRWG